MESHQAVVALAALAQSHRLRVFRALVVAGRAGLNPTVLSGDLDLPPATLSFHLKELLHSGLISQSRAGRNLVYRVRFDQMQELMAFLTENCCGGAPCQTPAAHIRIESEIT